MKIINLLIVIVFVSSVVYGQSNFIVKSDTVFSTDDYLYKDTLFKDYAKVDVFPLFKGGKDSIQAFFNHNVVFSDEEKNLFCRYHIVFIVNKIGKILNIELKSNKLPGSEKILSVCQKMASWIPATKDMKPVNCYYRLGFTNRSGNLSVDYREK